MIGTRAGLVLLGIAFLALLVLPSVLGIGLTPASTTVDYKPGAVVTGKIKVIGNGRMLLTSSDPRLSLEKNYIDGTSVITYSITMQNFDPGPTSIEINASEIGSGGMISTQATVTAKVIVLRAASGRFLTAQVLPPKDGSSAFYIKVANKGTEDLAQVDATVDVSSGGNFSQRFSTDTRQLAAGQEAILEAPETLADGAYHYTATVRFDGDVKTVKGDFMLGKPEVAYDGFIARSFSLGSISEFVVTLDNRFDRSVLTNLTVSLSQNGALLDRFAQQAQIPGGTKRALSAYVNTKNAVEGPATLSVKVAYTGSTNTRDVPVTLSRDRVMAVGQVTGSSGSNVNVVLLLILAGIVLNSALIFILFRRRNA